MLKETEEALGFVVLFIIVHPEPLGYAYEFYKLFLCLLQKAIFGLSTFSKDHTRFCYFGYRMSLV